MEKLEGKYLIEAVFFLEMNISHEKFVLEFHLLNMKGIRIVWNGLEIVYDANVYKPT